MRHIRVVRDGANNPEATFRWPPSLLQMSLQQRVSLVEEVMAIPGVDACAAAEDCLTARLCPNLVWDGEPDIENKVVQTIDAAIIRALKRRRG